MNQETWTAVDRYLDQALGKSDPVLEAALAASKAAGLPEIAVAPNQGRLLGILARTLGARQILEIGTLGGYSTIWMARALPADGRLVTLEMLPKHAEVARANLARAGLASVVDVRVGPALELLEKLVAEGAGPFDLVFVDADKASLPDYFQWALKLGRPGSLLVFDNTVRDGSVLDAASSDPSVQGTRRLNVVLAAEKRVTATAIQTVGLKGYDGFTLVRIDA